MLRLYFNCHSRKKEMIGNRVIKTNDSNATQIFGNNKVSTSLYTWYNFIPFAFVSMICRFTNLYFLVVGGLSCWKQITPLSTGAVWVQIIVVYFLYFIRVVIDDLKRNNRDKEVNSRKFTVIHDHVPMLVKSQDILCGDILILDNFVECPADIVLIHSSNDDGTCCIDTSNINGETKPVGIFSFPDIQNIGLDEISTTHLVVTCSQPNPDFEEFSGMITNGNTSYSLSPSNFIPAGTNVTNACNVYGIVVYTGKDRKINLNYNHTPIKYTQAEAFVDTCSFFIFVFQIIFTIIWGIVGNIKREKFEKEMPYLTLFFEFGPSKASMYFRIFLILSTMISFSMKIIFEITKFIYAAFIKFDEKLYDKIERIVPHVNNSSVIKDLGSIQYLFTDKTGTLTQNEKVLQKVVIGKTVYGASEKAEDIYNDNRLIDLLTIKEDPRKGRKANQPNQMITNSENRLSDSEIKRQKALRFIFCLAICHSCKKTGSNDNPIFEGTSPEEICFLNGLKKLKFRISIDYPDITIESSELSLPPTTFHIHAVLPFHHDNCYMSVIAENISTHDYFLFTKGAVEVLDTFTENFNTTNSALKQMERPKSLNYIHTTNVENYGSLNINLHDSILSSKRKKNESQFKKKNASDENNDNLDDFDNNHEIDVDSSERLSNIATHSKSKFGSGNLFKSKPKHNRKEYVNVMDDDSMRVKLMHAATHLVSPSQFRDPQFSHFDLDSSGSLNGTYTKNENQNTNNDSILDSIINTNDINANKNDDNNNNNNNNISNGNGNDNNNKKNDNNSLNPNEHNTHNFTYNMIENVDDHYSNFVSNSKKFASLGLQTMGMVYKSMDQKQFEIFITQYEAAQEYAENKIKAIQNLFSKVQKDMKVLGIAGIEDTLQPNVPETIEMLEKAGIKIWMVTGDMKENAIKIAHSSGIICDKGDIFDITSPLSCVSPSVVLANLNEYIGTLNLDDNPIYIVIDCSLDSFNEFINEENLPELTKLLLEATNVIITRANPQQKAFFVNLIRKKKKVTLAIGDGANDVSMINKANIGVGIMRNFHNQATLASDFAIKQFNHLQRLLLIHGRLASYRSSYIIQFCFYKSIMLGIVHIAFNFWNEFSSIMYLSRYNLICYNCLFTLLPAVFFVFDKDVEDDTVLLHPYLYSDSRNKTYCNGRTMTCWVIKAVYQAAIIVVIVHFCLNLNSIASADGSSISLAETEQTVYSALVLNVLFTISFNTQQFTSLNFIFIWGIWVLYIILMIVANVSPDFSIVGDMYLTVWRTISNPLLWMVTITATSFSVIPVFFVNSLLTSFLPTRAQKLRYREIKMQSKFMPAYYVLNNDVIEDFDISETIWDKSPHICAVLAALCSKKQNS